MPIYNGSDKIIGIYWNGRYHTAAYLGKTLVWKKSEPPALLDWLCFTAQEANSTIEMAVNGTLTKNQAFETSSDGVVWTEFVPGTTVITLANVGDKVFFRGNNETVSESNKNYLSYKMSGKIAASGNIMSLLSKTLSVSSIAFGYCFTDLFGQCTSLTTSPTLPALELSEHCYSCLFFGCTSLVQPPELPATELTVGCYSSMFSGCSSLANAPELPSVNLKEDCYYSMFYNCENIKRCPELPFITTAKSCCNRMFVNCFDSQEVMNIKLYPQTMSENCYYDMFFGANLSSSSIEIYATTPAQQSFAGMLDSSFIKSVKIHYSGDFNRSDNAFKNWLKNVGTTGDFYYNGTDTTRGDSAIPVGWTVHTF